MLGEIYVGELRLCDSAHEYIDDPNEPKGCPYCAIRRIYELACELRAKDPTVIGRIIEEARKW